MDFILLQGDSGGPLISYATKRKKYYHIIGVAAFNFKCGERNAPDVYTRVTSKFLLVQEPNINYHLVKEPKINYHLVKEPKINYHLVKADFSYCY